MSHQSPVALCIALLASSVFAAPGALNESPPVMADSIPWPNPTLAGCEESLPFTLIDDFSDGNEENDLGGYWFPLYDTTAFPTGWRDWNDWQKHMEITEGDFQSDSHSPGTLTLTTILRQCQESDVDFRSNNSSVATGLRSEGTLSGGDSLTGISFQITRRKSGPLIPSLRFLTVQEEGDSGWSERVVDIPFSGFDTAPTRKVCLRPADLKLARHSENVGMGPVNPRRFFWFEWLVRMPSSPNPFGAYDTTIFSLTDIRFHGSRIFKSSVWLELDTAKDTTKDTIFRWPGKGVAQFKYIMHDTSLSRRPYVNSFNWNSTCTNPNVGTRPRSRPAPALAVRTESNSLLLTGTEGFRQLEILSADGRPLKRFAPTSRLQIDLPRGAYLLVGEGPNKREVRPFAVAR